MKKALKISALLMAFVLVIAGTVGVTLALLTSKSETVTNTFSIGNVKISLAETTTDNDYKLIPGNTISKDPTITVGADSEDCWIYVRLEVANDLAAVLTLDYDAAWEVKSTTAGTATTVIILKPKATKTANDKIAVFGDNNILVKDNATADDLDKANDKTLVVTAYAVQKANVDDADDAWTALQQAFTELA